MNFIFDHGTMVWAILAVVGLTVWGLLGSAGIYAVVRIYRWATSIGRPGAYGLANLAAVGLAFSVVALFVAYIVVIGGLSIILFPN